jgi:hypothetical protein
MTPRGGRQGMGPQAGGAVQAGGAAGGWGRRRVGPCRRGEGFRLAGAPGSIIGESSTPARPRRSYFSRLAGSLRT